MLSSHRFLPLARVEAGMVLSDEVLDGQGQVLLPAGTVITADLLARLPAHGVDALPIAVPPAASGEPLDRDAIQRRIAQVFRRIDPADPAHAASLQLRHAVEAYRLGEVLP
ncbi:hypothetical protein [Pseudoduganella sp. GCM10020061]|uniref:hypothetical protein n=1 Tax=Pseudoduganella sp. GCM10020061 TaxID=3317345 RepID=UPI00363BCADB